MPEIKRGVSLQGYPPAPFPISFGVEAVVLSALRDAAVEGGDDIVMPDADFRALVSKAFSTAYGSVSVSLDILVDRVAGHIKKAADKLAVPTPTPKPAAKGFGSHLMGWLDSMTPTTLCLYLAEYDPVKASQVYWQHDRFLVEEAARAKAEAEWVRAVLAFEASMYGFGGSYKDEAATEYDITKGEGRGVLKDLGF